MTTPDKNYISIHGDGTGNIYMGDRLLFAAGDYSQPREIHLGDIIPPDDSYADALKLSGVVDLQVHADAIWGGYEDCIDINHCRRVALYIHRADAPGKYVATIKGGSDGIELDIDVVGYRGDETDFDIGNWSDQSMERTKRVWIRAGGQGFPLRCRVLHGWVPKLWGGQWVVNKSMKGWFGFAYGLLKKVLRVVGGGQ